jgi:hypothetical protein
MILSHRGSSRAVGAGPNLARNTGINASIDTANTSSPAHASKFETLQDATDRPDRTCLPESRTSGQTLD